ncbi:MAG: LLM class F420-dependent oxidoreductase [Pseudomonadales bacterium]|jgi:probable F420-dependent oxidoreductase|nr:LLM class F420-dependent oxidoreductase [Pseudomonadales bacterium]
MKIGIIPVNVGYTAVDQFVAVAQAAEAAGFESAWTFEHVVVPAAYDSRYPYSGSGKMGVAPEVNFIDPLIALATVAAHTTRLRLGTGVNILPQSNPLLLAKQAASLDLVSGGRFMLGVGIGWLAEEFRAMGVPFEHRGARFDDYISAMKKVWSGGLVEHASEFLDWSGFKSYPLPVQTPFPVIIGGSKGKAFERIAKYGTGWYAPCESAGDLAPMLTQLKDACSALGRDYAEIEITAMWRPELGIDRIRALRDEGVHRVVARMIPDPRHDLLGQIARVGDEVIARL